MVNNLGRKVMKSRLTILLILVNPTVPTRDHRGCM